MSEERNYGPAYATEIAAINPHPNADRLELATVGAWQSIVPKGQYQPGDKIVFAEIDSLVPNREWSSFMFTGSDASKDFIRVKNIRLRGEFSQGVVFPRDIADCPDGIVNQHLDIRKYEKPVPAQLAGKVKGSFPTKFCKKTDETNLLRSPQLLEEVDPSDAIIATTKLDGSSCTVILLGEDDERFKDDSDFAVCSRNMMLEETDGNSFWQAVRDADIEQRLREGQELMKGIFEGKKVRLVLQGELCGPGIQKNPLGLRVPTFFAFNASIDGEYLPAPVVESMCRGFKINHVPAILIDPWSRDIEVFKREAENLTYPDGNPAEGIVLRTASGSPSKKLGKMWSVKIINPSYKD